MNIPNGRRYVALSTQGELLAEIERLQQVQRNNPPHSMEWRSASAFLAPLFAEMAKRSAQR